MTDSLETLIARGGVLMIPLLACSVIAFTVIIERALFWGWRGLLAQPQARRRYLAQASRGRSDFAAKCRDPLIRLVVRAGSDPTAWQLIVEREARAFRRLMPVLDTIISVAPLLGILGTVVGIMVSFDMVGQRSTPDPLDAIGGIAQAFITTAAGLVIAIASLTAFNFFATRERKALEQIQEARLLLEQSAVDDD